MLMQEDDPVAMLACQPFRSSALPQVYCHVAGLHRSGRAHLDSGLVLASGGQADVLGGVPGAAAVLDGDCKRPNLSSRRGVQVRVKAQRHAAVGVVLLTHNSSCTHHTAMRHNLNRPLHILGPLATVWNVAASCSTWDSAYTP